MNRDEEFAALMVAGTAIIVIPIIVVIGLAWFVLSHM